MSFALKDTPAVRGIHVDDMACAVVLREQVGVLGQMSAAVIGQKSADIVHSVHGRAPCTGIGCFGSGSLLGFLVSSVPYRQEEIDDGAPGIPENIGYGLLRRFLMQLNTVRGQLHSYTGPVKSAVQIW